MLTGNIRHRSSLCGLVLEVEVKMQDISLPSDHYMVWRKAKAEDLNHIGRITSQLWEEKSHG